MRGRNPGQPKKLNLHESSWTCKPNSVCGIAPAGRPFLWAAHYCAAQATYPEVVARRAGTCPAKLALRTGSLPIWSCSVWGLPCPLHYCGGGALLPHLFTLTQALPPRRYVFCGTSRQPTLRSASRTLSGTLLCGVRTFLPHLLTKRERPSGPAAYTMIICEGDCWLGIEFLRPRASSLAVWVGHSCPTWSPRSAVEKAYFGIEFVRARAPVPPQNLLI